MIELINRNRIEIPDRQRTVLEADKLASLKESIEARGLIHPITVREPIPEEGECPDSFYLVAGFRRLQAIEQLWADNAPLRFSQMTIEPPKVPCIFLKDLDPLEAQEIELEENLRRVNLTYREEACAIARLHKLRSSQAALMGDGWNLTKTAEEVKQIRGVTMAASEVSNAVLIAENLDKIGYAKSKKDAIKNILREHEELFSKELARRQLTKSTRVVEGINLRIVDAIEGLQQIANNSVHLIITDPPYGVGAQEYDGSASHHHSYQDAWTPTKALLQSFLQEGARVVKNSGAHLYMFCDLLNFPTLKSIAMSLGWDVWPRPLIWVKDTGHIPMAHYGPQRLYETILFANKGGRQTNLLKGDVLQYPNPKQKLHAAQKPVELYRDLILRSSYPGDVVLDPFCGSGTIFVASLLENRVPIGLDSDPRASTWVEERIKNEVPAVRQQR